MVVADHGQPDGAIWDGVQTFKAYARGAGLPVLRFVHPRWTGLVSALSRADADVYYTSCAGGLVGQVAMFCARRGKRFVFRTASDADCMPDALISLGRWHRRDKWLYARTACGALPSVLVQTVRQQELMRRNYGIESSIAGLVVQPGRSEREFGERDIDALWVSNMRSVKRPDVLLDVAEQAAAAFPSTWSAARCAGARRFFETVKAQAASRSNVTFHGAVPYRDISPFYQPRACAREHLRHRGIPEHLSAGVGQRHAGRRVLRSGRSHRARGTRRDGADGVRDERGGANA